MILPDFDDPDEDALAAPSNSMADLLFTMIAILLLAFMSILPGLALGAWTHQRTPTQASATPLSQITFQSAGERATVFLARRDGLVLPEAGAPPIARDAILDNAQLTSLLEAQIRQQVMVTLFVMQDGLETAFEFEALAASRGVRRIQQIRFDGACELSGHIRIAECEIREPAR